ncbi:DUF4304 domain-containing protein [Kribbella sp. C-35]|uniref:DUF4304 domain-containing protein n=1 Tax=Kribbella sp. C-35 TaxID=2789276 RepID=UPI003978EF35
MELQDELAEVVSADLARLGFGRRSNSWYRAGKYVYAVVSLQRSSWDSSVYVNVGLSPVEQANRGWLPESKCQVRFRADAIRSVSPAGLALLSEAGLSSAGHEDWQERVRRDLIDPLVQILERVVDLESLGQIVRSELSAKVMVHRDIRAALHLEGD